MRRWMLVPICVVVALSGCAGFADYQSARLVGEGSTEITPGVSQSYLRGAGQTERGFTHYGVRVARGIAEGGDLVFGLEYIRPGGDAAESRWVFGAGPKLSIVPDRLAFWLPVGMGTVGSGGGTRAWQTNPTLLFTAEPTPDLEVTPSAKVLIPLNSEDRGNYALVFNLGLGWSPSDADWTLRPEGGVIWDPGQSDQLGLHFGIGISIPLRP